MESKTILVAGAGGFIGGHLVEYLVKQGHYLIGVDKKMPEFRKTKADVFKVRDLTIPENCLEVTTDVDEVYQLAADMGGMGHIANHQMDAFHNSNLINTYMPWACVQNKVKKLFFSSSVCVYPTHLQQEDINVLSEKDAIPANPNEAYGWEKLMAELRYLEYQKHGLETRIARFENTYGPYGTFDGGREKAPAALCRKVAKAQDRTEIEMWGDGKATRPFTYVEDLCEGIYRLMNSNIKTPVNLGQDKAITINELAELIIDISGKKLGIKHISGPIGVKTRAISHDLAKQELKWEPTTSLRDGLIKTYNWISEQI